MANTAENPKQTTKKLVLLDAHAILHRAYHALPDFVSPKGEPTGGLYGVTTMPSRLLMSSSRTLLWLVTIFPDQLFVMMCTKITKQVERKLKMILLLR